MGDALLADLPLPITFHCVPVVPESPPTPDLMRLFVRSGDAIHAFPELQRRRPDWVAALAALEGSP